MKKVLIATPCYNGNVTMGYMQSVLKTILAGPTHGYEIELVQNTDSLVPRARNNLVATFLEGKWDYLFWVDADISFKVEQFFRVLEIDRGVVAAVYPLKKFFFPTEPTQRVGRELEASLMRYALNLKDETADIPEDHFIEVLDAATGFMCIHRSVLESMVAAYPELKYQSDQTTLGAVESDKHYLFFDTMIEGNRYLSEDYAFCRRAQKLGYRIWADIRSELTHSGTVEFRGSVLETTAANQVA